MADETMGPEAKPLLGYWGSPMRPKRADPGIERQFEREAVALPIYAAMVAHEYRGEEGSVSNARDSFVLADFWITERDRQRKNGRAPEPDPNARATGLDASGSIVLGERNDPPLWVSGTSLLRFALFEQPSGVVVMKGAGPLLFEDRDAAGRWLSAHPSLRAGVAEVRVTIAPVVEV